MAGLRGSQAFLVAGKQSAKGTPVTKWQDKYFFEGGNISPSRSTDQLSETDSQRNAGDFFVQQTAVEGSPEVYVRDASIHHLLEYALGTATHSGTTNFTHTITQAAALPYLTLGKGQGALLFEQYNDNKVDSLDLAWATGSPGIATVNIMGLASVRQAAEWGSELAPPAAAEVAPLNWNVAEVTLAGAETRLASSFEMSIANNLTLQQTDNSVPFDVVEGLAAVTGGLDLIFETLAEYNRFHYGSTTGTTQSPELGTTTLKVVLERGVNNSLTLEFPKIAYTEFPVEPDPGGAPVVASVKFAAQRNAEGFVKAIVKNQVEK